MVTFIGEIFLVVAYISESPNTVIVLSLTRIDIFIHKRDELHGLHRVYWQFKHLVLWGGSGQYIHSYTLCIPWPSSKNSQIHDLLCEGSGYNMVVTRGNDVSSMHRMAGLAGENDRWNLYWTLNRTWTSSNFQPWRHPQTCNLSQCPSQCHLQRCPSQFSYIILDFVKFFHPPLHHHPVLASPSSPNRLTPSLPPLAASPRCLRHSLSILATQATRHQHSSLLPDIFTFWGWMLNIELPPDLVTVLISKRLWRPCRDRRWLHLNQPTILTHLK